MAPFRANMFTQWIRGIQRGAITVWREHDWITALGALTGVFLLLQLIILVLLGVQGLQTLLKTQTDLRLEIQAEASDQQIQEFLADLNQLTYINEYIYVTKQQAYAQMKKQDPELIAFLEEFDLDNPFPETVAVTLVSLDDYRIFTEFLRQEQWHSVIDPNFLSEATDQEEYVYELLELTNTGQVLTIFFLVLVVGILLFVTTELVRGRVLRRAEEILVEHLSGAYAMTILLPFAVEATMLLLMALALSVAILIVIFFGMPLVEPTLNIKESLKPIIMNTGDLLQKKLWLLLIIELIALPCIGWLGAWMGTLAKINARSLILHRH